MTQVVFKVLKKVESFITGEMFLFLVLIFTFILGVHNPALSQGWAYAYKMGVGPCKIISNNNIVILSYQGNDYFAGAAWANGRWYAVTYISHNLIYCDTVTGLNTIVGNLGSVSGTPVALCWDATTSKMFMLTAAPNNLYSVNINTGADSLIAPIQGIQGNPFTGAIDNYGDGALYSFAPHAGPCLYTINKTTGQATLRAAVGGTPYGPQSMAFKSGMIYWAYYKQNTESYLVRVNKYTGMGTTVGRFPDSTELVGFVIPYNVTAIETGSEGLPAEFHLGQNYPNPFNSYTNIKYDIARSSYVKLGVYDILGREVATLVDGELMPGTYKIEWDAGNFPSGVYFYKLTARDFLETKKIVLVK